MQKNKEIKNLYGLTIFNGILSFHSLFGSLKEKLKPLRDDYPL